MLGTMPLLVWGLATFIVATPANQMPPPVDSVFDVHVVVVDGEQSLAIEGAVIEVLGAPVLPHAGWWATLHKNSGGPIVVRVTAPRFQTQIIVMRPGTWVVKMMRVRRV